MRRLTGSIAQVAALRRRLWGLTVCACRVWACAAVRCSAGGGVGVQQLGYKAPLCKLAPVWIACYPVSPSGAQVFA